jgi:hypothetical protein
MITRVSRPRTWSDEDLAAAIDGAATWGQVVRRLKLTPAMSAERSARGHAARLGLDVTHLPPAAYPVKPIPAEPDRNVDPAALADAVARSWSWAGALRVLGASSDGDNYRWIRNLVAKAGVDTSHFLPRGGHRHREPRHQLGGMARSGVQGPDC